MSRESNPAIPIAVIAALLMLAPSAEARIGENYRQCVARYGNSVTNFPGLTHLLGVAVFEKSGINVTVAFDRPNRQGFLVFYAAGDFITSEGRGNLSELKENEIASLMASLNVGWDSTEYEAPKQNPGTGGNSRIDPSMRTMADTRRGKIKATYMMPSTAMPRRRQGDDANVPKWLKNLDVAKNAVKDFLEAITLEKIENEFDPPYLTNVKIFIGSAGSRFSGIYALQPYRRSGDHLFAFKIIADGQCYGLVIVNSDASKAFSGWAEAYSKTCEIVEKEDKGRVLEGF